MLLLLKYNKIMKYATIISGLIGIMIWGVINAIILLLILLSVLMKPGVFARSIAQLSNETFMRFFILFISNALNIILKSLNI